MEKYFKNISNIFFLIKIKYQHLKTIINITYMNFYCLYTFINFYDMVLTLVIKIYESVCGVTEMFRTIDTHAIISLRTAKREILSYWSLNVSNSQKHT